MRAATAACSSSRESAPAGAGLGLSICQRIVDAMGGTLWCEDSPLGGAQLRFVLPMVAPVEA